MLLARLDDWIARLEQAQQAVAAEGLNARLQARIGADLSERLSQQLVALRGRRRRVTASPSLARWGTPDTAVCERLFDECLVFLQAARSRGPDAQPDLCEIT